jgi:hypothetical protein
MAKKGLTLFNGEGIRCHTLASARPVNFAFAVMSQLAKGRCHKRLLQKV